MVVNVWDLERGVLRRTMPVFETLESVGLVEIEEGEESKKGKEKAGTSRRAIFTGGDKGAIRLWDLLTGEQIRTKAGEGQGSDGKVHEILSIMYVHSFFMFLAY